MKRTKRLILAALFAIMLVTFGAPTRRASGGNQNQNQNQNQNDPATVQIDNFSFAPMEMAVSAGTVVTWINKDDVPHTVVSVEKKFGSKALDTSEKFSFTFTEPGAYQYFCSVHPRMVGKIVVQ